MAHGAPSPCKGEGEGVAAEERRAGFEAWTGRGVGTATPTCPPPCRGRDADGIDSTGSGRMAHGAPLPLQGGGWEGVAAEERRAGLEAWAGREASEGRPPPVLPLAGGGTQAESMAPLAADGPRRTPPPA